VVFAADYPFLNILWSMIIFFSWVVWIWIMIVILTDLFRRRDTSGWVKAAWVVFLILLPFVGVLVYLIINHDGMNERSAAAAKGQQAQFDEYVQSVAQTGGPAAEIEKAKALLDSGAITQAEFEAIKAKALS
jgi:Short C-terminal domain/Phospholipase_D-nuclease N-terminal